ncbi:MAG: hypothetical protein QOE90_1689 [Thermoplasmata archaeon]|nr:hypothetical protein [Thermoplasmata archaeon]
MRLKGRRAVPDPVKKDLEPILEAIREVETSLACRASRQGGALMVMGGVIAALIAAFYQLVVWNPAPYRAALGPLLGWAWLAPMAVGYAAGIVAGVRLQRAGGSRREAILDASPGVLSGLIAALLSATGAWTHIPGALLVGFGVSLALRVRHARPLMRTPSWALAALSAVAGLALLVAPVAWSWLVMGLLVGGSLVALGRLRMALAG